MQNSDFSDMSWNADESVDVVNVLTGNSVYNIGEWCRYLKAVDSLSVDASCSMSDEGVVVSKVSVDASALGTHKNLSFDSAKSVTVGNDGFVNWIVHMFPNKDFASQMQTCMDAGECFHGVYAEFFDPTSFAYVDADLSRNANDENWLLDVHIDIYSEPFKVDVGSGGDSITTQHTRIGSIEMAITDNKLDVKIKH